MSAYHSIVHWRLGDDVLVVLPGYHVACWALLIDGTFNDYFFQPDMTELLDQALVVRDFVRTGRHMCDGLPDRRLLRAFSNKTTTS